MADNIETETQSKDPVPYERFQKVAEERRAFQTELETTKSQLMELRGQTRELATWQSKYEQLEADFSRYKTTAAEERDLMSLGLTDPEAVDAARYWHSKTPQENRPALGEWVKALKAAPETMPRGLAPYLVVSGSDGQTIRLPNTKPAVVTPPAAEPVYSSKVIANMTPEEYKAHRANILKHNFNKTVQ